MILSILYRGPLTSCNYGCTYCPFAKRRESEARLAQDRTAVERFVNWLSQQTEHQWRVLFTPWGEALVRSWYRSAIVRLSQLEHIEFVAAQTNLSCGLGWLRLCDRNKVGLWTTYHPSEVDRSKFLQRVQNARQVGVRLSVGMVGVTEAFSEIEAMRAALPPEVPLWINPQQPRPRAYSPEEIEFLSRIDPQFSRTASPQRTRGLPCMSGETSFTVDGDGQMRRCHFVDEVIGNIFVSNWEASLKSRSCPNRSCHCFLGLSQFKPLGLADDYGANLLLRIPLPTTPGV